MKDLLVRPEPCYLGSYRASIGKVNDNRVIVRYSKVVTRSIDSLMDNGVRI